VQPLVQLQPAAHRLQQRDRRVELPARRRQIHPAVSTEARRLCGRGRSPFQWQPPAVRAKRRHELEDLRGEAGRHRAAAGLADARRRRRVRPLLRAGRPDHLRLGRELPGGALLERPAASRGEPLLDGRRRRPRAAALFRSGPRPVSDRPERRANHVHALGLHRDPARVPADTDDDESGRHGAARAVRLELVVAERAVLRAADSRRQRQVRRHRQRLPRRAADGLARGVRRHEGLERRRRRGAADSRPRQEGRTRHQGEAGARHLAAVSAPLSAQREILHRGVPAIRGPQLGHLPRRRIRQPRTDLRAAGLGAAGADSAAGDGDRRAFRITSTSPSRRRRFTCTTSITARACAACRAAR